MKILKMIVFATLLIKSIAQAKVSESVGEAMFTLEDCIAYALEHSPELQQRNLDHEDRLLDSIIARSSFDISIDYNTDIEPENLEHDNSVTVSKRFLGGIDVSTTGSLDRHYRSGIGSASWSVRVSKQILGGGSYLESRNSIDDSVLDITIALNNISKEKRRLVSEVKGAFYQVIRDTQSLSIQKRRLERAIKNLEHTRERERPLDIITAEIEVPDNQLSVLQRKRAIHANIDRLKEIMGMSIDKTLNLNLDFDFQVVRVDVMEDVKFSINNEEDFLNNLLEREKVDKDIIIQRRQIWPDVTLSAEHTANSEVNEVNLRGVDEQIYSLAFSWDLGSRRDFSEYRREKNRLERNQLNYFSLKQEKVRILYDLSRQLEETEQSIKIQEDRLRLVEFQVELFKDRWENGEIDILELLRSQNNFEDTEVALVNLKVGYLELLAEYNFEVGR